MRAPATILAELRKRDLYELASRVAAEHRMSTEELCSDGKRARIVAARHALWEQLRLIVSSNAEIARIWGVDHSSINFALREPPAIVEVVLAIWPSDDFREYVLRWRKKRDPFGVTDCDTGETWWFAEYSAARAEFDRMCRAAGAPSFVGRARARDPDTPPTEPPALVGGGAP